MMNRLVFILVLCCLLFVGSFSNHAKAFVTADNNNATKRQIKSITAKQAANIVKSRYNGKVLKVSTLKHGYRVKLLKKDGRIIAVYVDGVSGKIKG